MGRRFRALEPREQEVLVLLGKGYSDEEIASVLGLPLRRARVVINRVVAAIPMRARVQSGDPEWPLTRREPEVKALILAGMTNREIAERLTLGV